MKGSLIIVGFFVLGTICGVCHLLPFDIAETNISYYALCALMFSVGLSVGNDPQTLKNFRSLNPRLVFLPIMTILGTLAGSAAVSLILTHRSITDCLAVGSGFGYYSLSSIFITEYKGAELGTIALLANISREILTLLAAPLLVRWFGNLAPISAGGATTMDTTLPIITRTAGQQFVVVSIFHGFVVDFSVPFLVTLFFEKRNFQVPSRVIRRSVAGLTSNRTSAGKARCFNALASFVNGVKWACIGSLFISLTCGFCHGSLSARAPVQSSEERRKV